MKRDFNLIRDILLNIEKQENRYDNVKIEPIGSFSEEEVLYHFSLLKDAGLIEGTVYMNLESTVNLTYKGHDFLDKAKNKKVWDQTLKFIKDKGTSVSFDILMEVLKTYTLKHLNLG